MSHNVLTYHYYMNFILDTILSAEDNQTSSVYLSYTLDMALVVGEHDNFQYSEMISGSGHRKRIVHKHF